MCPPCNPPLFPCLPRPRRGREDQHLLRGPLARAPGVSKAIGIKQGARVAAQAEKTAKAAWVREHGTHARAKTAPFSKGTSALREMPAENRGNWR